MLRDILYRNSFCLFSVMVSPFVGTLYRYFPKSDSEVFFNHSQTAIMFSLNEPFGTNFLSNRALPMVNPHAPASQTSAMRLYESMEPAETIGTPVAFTTSVSS